MLESMKHIKKQSLIHTGKIRYVLCSENVLKELLNKSGGKKTYKLS